MSATSPTPSASPVPSAPAAPALPQLVAILAFDGQNRLAVRALGSKRGLPFTGSDIAMATHRLQGAFALPSANPVEYFSADAGGRRYRVYFAQVSGQSADPEIAFYSLDALAGDSGALAPSLAALLPPLDEHLVELPYLHLGENDFIYKFRPEKARNTAIYTQDPTASALYQSQLCSAIKALARVHERTATEPVELDFGAVRYVIPSHFGFCLGVKNAIERAYETLAAHPNQRVFMLSELIHNPFVNDDLRRRGLRYLQTDKGQPYLVDGAKATGAPGETQLWSTLTPEDIVIIPAFGATDEDKRRLIRRGLPVYAYDATCMLVEKVWKAARAYGRSGYTVVIHGKHEHEETKATFSNTRRHGPAVIVRDLPETQRLTALIELSRTNAAAAQARFESEFAGKHTPAFSVARDLQRIAVVNQTTLLMNETIAIIEHLTETYGRLYGEAEAAVRVGGGARRDTLCYATQVNQDALAQALEGPLDAAFVIGGKNSSNTYQLHRLCERAMGGRAYFIQGERAILSLAEVEHYIFPAHGPGSGGRIEVLPLWRDGAATLAPKRILITGGASCPDGLIQQVVARLNSLFTAAGATLYPIEEVLRDLGQDGTAAGESGD